MVCAIEALKTARDKRMCVIVPLMLQKKFVPPDPNVRHKAKLFRGAREKSQRLVYLMTVLKD